MRTPYLSLAFGFTFGTCLLGALPVRAAPIFSDTIYFGSSALPSVPNVFNLSEVAFIPADQPGPFMGIDQIGSGVPNNIGVVLYEDPGHMAVSDQLWTEDGTWNFASDPNLVGFAQRGISLLGGVIEDGTSQDLSTFFGLPAGSVEVQSNTDVPEPAALGVLGLGALGLMRRRRRA